MNAPNEDVAKAITVADTLASAGRLNAEQDAAFYTAVVNETNWGGNVRVVRPTTDWELHKLALGNRAMVPSTEASDPNVRRGVTASKIEMVPKNVMVPVEISDDFKRENIEGENVEQKILGMFGSQFSNDAEKMFWHGDTTGPAALQSDLVSGGSSTQYIKDSLHSLMNGWVKLATASGHILDAAGAEMSSKLVSKALRELPTKFRNNPASLRLFAASNTLQLWLEALSDRGTALGDSVTTGQKGLKPFGIQPVSMPLLDFEPKIVKHVTLTGTTAVDLGYTDITDVVVLPSTLGSTPVTPYVLTTDYVLDAAAGTIVRPGSGSAIGSGATVKVTFNIKPVLILTPANNLIVGIGRGIEIEKARDIYKRTDGYAISAKLGCQIQDTDAVVVVKNLSTEIV